MRKLTRVNEFLNKKQEISENKETEIILNGPDTIKNIFLNELIKLNKLEEVSGTLINYLTEDKTMKNLSHKEKQSLLRDITVIQTNSRDFIFKVAELSTKNEFIKKLLDITQTKTEKVISENGEIIQSSISEDDRKTLTRLLVDLVNDRTKD